MASPCTAVSKASKPKACQLLLVLVLLNCSCRAFARKNQEKNGNRGHAEDAGLTKANTSVSKTFRTPEASYHAVEFDDLSAAPWLLPPHAYPPYAGLHNDLPALLSVQARNTQISIGLFTKPLTSMLLNWVFTLVHLGRTPNYIVATIDTQSLEKCQLLKLPCWDARAYLQGLENVTFESEVKHPGRKFQGTTFQWLTMARIQLLLPVLQLGYDAHFSDIDVVFVRDVWASYLPVMNALQADATFMREMFENNTVNAGNFVVLANQRTLALVEAWANNSPEKMDFGGDQEYLNSAFMKGVVWDDCYSRDDCEKLANEQNLAAVYPYPEQMTGAWGGQCPSHKYTQCAPHMVALHYICLRGKKAKQQMMQKHGLWFVGNTSSTTPTVWFEPTEYPLLHCETPADLFPRSDEV